jgi:hypothetical protein
MFCITIYIHPTWKNLNINLNYFNTIIFYSPFSILFAKFEVGK